jgi:hypothetical protein
MSSGFYYQNQQIMFSRVQSQKQTGNIPDVAKAGAPE